MRRRARLALIAAGWLVLGPAGSAQPALPPGACPALRWQADHPAFGGLSALAVTADGAGLIALTDRGNWLSARVGRGPDLCPIAVALDRLAPLADTGGAPLARGRSDTEGLAILPGGALAVSLEGRRPRVLIYAAPGATPQQPPAPAAFRAMGANAALESLAADVAGTLYTLAEAPQGQAFPVWRLRGGVWDQPFALPARGGFRAVDAAIGPDGRFYLLERRFLPPIGFASRLRRFDLGPAGPAAETVLMTSPPGLYDNLEGLAIWRDGAGGLRASLVSDNNFVPVQRTELVDLALPD
ncbi:MAG: esterase-like activity of phytase family protein [Rhodobacterales bacterium]|nr:esterase-like activity of phytase family protein [Rhodobacterales bacterium]